MIEKQAVDEGTNPERALTTARTIDAARERVFGAFADAEKLARWWGPKGFTNTFEEFEFRPGGRWRFVMHSPEGANYPNESVFVEIVPNERVVLEHVCAPHFVATITLEDDGPGRTRVGFRQEFDTPEMCRKIAAVAVDANEQNLDRLTAVVCE